VAEANRKEGEDGGNEWPTLAAHDDLVAAENVVQEGVELGRAERVHELLESFKRQHLLRGRLPVNTRGQRTDHDQNGARLRQSIAQRRT
jgi:hypothetical protein